MQVRNLVALLAIASLLAAEENNAGGAAKAAAGTPAPAASAAAAQIITEPPPLGSSILPAMVGGTYDPYLDEPSFPSGNYFRKHFQFPSTKVELRPPVRLQDFVVGDKIELSLKNYIELVLANNTDVEIQRHSVDDERNNITRAFGVFDPILTGSFNNQRTKSPSSSVLDGANTLSTLNQPWNLGFQQTLINSMNGVARVPNVGLSLRHRISLAGKARHDGYTGRVEAEVSQAYSPKELVPFFCSGFGQRNKALATVFFCTSNQRQEFIMQGCGMAATALTQKADGACIHINALHRNSGFGQPASLPHSDNPTVAHPFILLKQSGLDFLLLCNCDLRLALRRSSFKTEAKTRIGAHVFTSNSFLHDRRKHFQFGQSRVETSRTHDVARWFGSKLGIISADPICHLQRRYDFDVLKISGDRGPGRQISDQSVLIRITLREE